MIQILEIGLEGFRGYPKTATFAFPEVEGGSILIFGPNAFGKSSLTDAFEFLLDEDGTLERLGIRKSEMNSGRSRLRNSQIASAEPSRVRLAFYDGVSRRESTRNATIDPEPLDAALQFVAGCRKVPFIVRGPELGKFVATVTPQERYDELAACLSAKSLTSLQSRIRTLQSSLKDDSSEKREQASIEQDVRRVTKGALTGWDRQRALDWFAAETKSLALGAPSPASFSDGDPYVADLKERATNEVATVQRAPLEKAYASLRALLPSQEQQPLLDPFNNQQAAQKLVNDLTAASNASNTLRVIEAARELLTGSDIRQCPICETTFDETRFGTRAGILEHLRVVHDGLRDLVAASSALAAAKTALLSQRQSVDAVLTRACELLELDIAPTVAAWHSLHDALISGRGDGAKDLEARIAALADDAKKRIDSMKPDAPRVFGPALELAKQLRDLGERSDALVKKIAARAFALGEVAKARVLIDKQIHAFFENAVAAISGDTVRFYNSVQKYAKVPVAITIRLADVEHQDSRAVEVLVDQPGVTDEKPRAILSDSQMNTLALGMRIAFIRRFNPEMPFVLLDDVVTSYDAEFRRETAKVILNEMAGLQFLVLTHDEQFFNFVKSQAGGRWRCMRIVGYDVSHGPKFSDARTKEDEVERALSAGQPAGNLIRQYIEDWLEDKCRAMGAKVLLRPIERPYEYSRHELFEALMAAADKRGLRAVKERDKAVAGFLREMQDAIIENEGSHYHENPFRRGSSGDDRSFWTDFISFAKRFACTCGNARITFDGTNRRPICRKCGLEFTLQ